MSLINKVISKISRSVSKKEVTSLSDNEIYPNFCLKASKDEKVFSNFRRNEVYNQILEHVSEKEGSQYIAEIIKQSSRLNEIKIFKENDRHGNPITVSYPEIGAVSPTTLRYIKVLTDLETKIGNLNDLKIVEIGVGYGGQCRIINSVTSPKSYTLIDLYAALALSKTYLSKYSLKADIIFKEMKELVNQEYDLLISNYAFTELPKNIQDIYLEKVILKSKKGYITYNEINPPSFNSYTKEKLVELIPNSKIYPEIPQTHEKNCLIIW